MLVVVVHGAAHPVLVVVLDVFFLRGNRIP
jgi:hypothetical protein